MCVCVYSTRIKKAADNAYLSVPSLSSWESAPRFKWPCQENGKQGAAGLIIESNVCVCVCERGRTLHIVVVRARPLVFLCRERNTRTSCSYP